MDTATGTRGGRRTLAVLAGVLGIFLAARAIAAPEAIRATDISPATVKADSRPVAVFGIDLTGSEQRLTGARVEFTNVAGFTAADLAQDLACEDGDATSCDGVQVWRDSGRDGLGDDALDAADTPLSTGFAFDGDCALADYLPPDAVCAATMAMAPSGVPAETEGAYTHFIAIRTSGTIAEGDRFTAGVHADGLTTEPARTTTPATTRVISADLTAPADPIVDGLGLSKAVGIVRAGATPVSTEEKASLQLWRSSEATCQGALTKVAEGVSGDLSKPHTDLIGLTEAQAARVRSFPAGSATVCYRIADEAGNLSGFTPDGTVPNTPSTSDVALLSASNLSGGKRIESAPDASGPRTFRLYLRPAGGAIERARTSDMLTPSYVELTTAQGASSRSNTTDIRRWGGLASLAAGDGVSYSRVNAAGNDSAATDDGSIPAAPGASDLALLRTSAVDGHQRVRASADPTPGRTFRLYGDTSGLGDWVAATGAGNPVLVTTSSTPRDSGTNQISIAGAALTSGTRLGFTAISAHGNGSDAAGDGSIPAAPHTSATTFSDATNSFRVLPFPVADGVGIDLFVGSDASGAYDAGARGRATSIAPVDVDEFDAGLGLFYSAVSTTSGNESPLTADGTIPTPPGAAATAGLSTSAATGHQRVIAAATNAAPQTFRLYGDGDGGDNWVPASALAQTSVPVEVTTGPTRTDSNGAAPTSSIYLGSEQLGAADAVGFTRSVDGNDSDVAADGTIPPAPIPAHMAVSDALNQMSASSAGANTHINLHMGTAADTAALAYDEAGADAVATSSAPVDIPDPFALDTIFYTATDAASGNESATIADGTVPLAPLATDALLLSASAAQDHQRVTSAIDPSGPKILRVYVDAGNGWVRATDELGSVVELPTAVGVATSTRTTTIKAGTETLAAGHVVGYARRTTEGNDSDVTGDGAIPAAPDASTLRASAASDTVKSTGVDLGSQVRVFASRSAEASVAYAEGVDTSLTPLSTSKAVDLSAGDRLHYSMVSDVTGNESALVSDGSIPVAPDAAMTSVSDARDEFIVPQASQSNRINIFLDASGTPSVGYANGADYTNVTSSPFAPGNDLPAHYVYYTATDAGSGNESTILSDGYIPAAPTDAASVMSASAARQRISSNPDSAARRLRLWLEPDAAGVWRMAAANANGSGTVEVLTSTLQEILSPEGIFVGGQPLGTGMGVGYTRLFGGNESDVAADGVIPAAPQNASHFIADANAGTATVAALAPTGTYRVFAGTAPVSPRTLHTLGLQTVISVSAFDAGDVVGYARTESGNESPALVDGSIPDAPDLAVASASDTGASDSDGVTSDDTPTIEAATVPNGAVTVFDESGQASSGSAGSDGLATMTLPARSEGSHSFTGVTTAGGNTSPMSDALDITIDKTAPAAPSTPAMNASSDTGRSSSDRITSDATPAFSVAAEPGSVVTLTGATGSSTASGSGIASPTSGTLADGAHQIGARATDLAGNTSAASAPTVVTIDTAAPAAPGTPDLVASSDTGASSSDDITSDATPALRITSLEDASLVTLHEAATGSGVADGDSITIVAGELADGAHGVVAKQTDLAGNTSSASDALTLRIDTRAAPLARPSLDPASDTGVSNSDGITSLNAVTVIARGAEQGATISLHDGAQQIAGGPALGDGSAAFAIELADGAHDLVAKQTDLAGNTSAASPARRIVVDTDAPSGSITAPEEIDGVATVTFDEHVTGVNEDNFQLQPDGSGAPVDADVSPAGDGTEATLRPQDELAPETEYTVVLAPEGTQAPTDLAGNPIPPVSRRFETPEVSSWTVVKDRKAFGGSYSLLQVADASASYAFKGDTITFYTLRSTTGGYATILIDGKTVRTINTFARAASYKQGYRFAGLGRGRHTITILVADAKPNGSSGRDVAVDAFRVGRTLVANPALRYR